MEKGKRIEKDIFINTGKNWKNRNSLGHWYLEFEICLEFNAWNLGFQKFRERSQFFRYKKHKIYQRKYSYGFCNYCCCGQRHPDE
ncbi:MAG: hypothetical protein U9N83_00400 [Thermodesulfobacteriota bacterium]|nr:hypothetical protein [Thermodesulfobacteriota bacterium]